MDPVLQRLGDVTIQRLEKPKEPKVELQNDTTSFEKSKENNEEVYTDPEEDSGDEEFPPEFTQEFPIPSMKRPLPPVQSHGTLKKFKFNEKGDITLEKKSDELGVSNFSEPEMSDYEEESEIEESDDPDMMNDTSIADVPKVSEKTTVEKGASEDEADSSASFFEKLVEQVDTPAPPTPSTSQKSSESAAEDDYDIDIKEKLKEMGEISFETVRKGEKPKKAEVATENEVVVTPAKKFGKVKYYIMNNTS